MAMRFHGPRCTLAASLVALSALSFQAFAQPTPAAATSPAGSGSASNPALGGQKPKGPAPRLPNGKPDLSGVWQGGGPVGDIKDGLLPGEEIAMLPEAEKLMKSRLSSEDPEARCLPTGVPRVAPYPWRVLQSPAFGDATILYFLFEGNIHSYRQIFVDGRGHPKDLEATWYGHSVGHWEGDTLVIEVTGFNDGTWFDRAGNYHSTSLKVTERYTLKDKDHIQYEATMEDPETFSKPWKVSVPLYRMIEPNAQLLEFKCVEFSEELLYGDLTKKTK
jgi:hypothetical protein